MKSNKRKQYGRVEELFIESGKTPQEISEIMLIPLATVYRWLREEGAQAKKDELKTTSWQMAQEIRGLLPGLVAKMKENPTGAQADAICKVVKTFKSISKESDFVGHALEAMKKFAEYLRENDPERADLLLDHIDGFIQKLYTDNKDK